MSVFEPRREAAQPETKTELDGTLVSLRARAERAKAASEDWISWEPHFPPDELLALLDRLEAAERERTDLRVEADTFRQVAQHHAKERKAVEARLLAAEKERDEETKRADAQYEHSLSLDARLLAAQQALREIADLEQRHGGVTVRYSGDPFVIARAALAAVGSDPQREDKP